MRNADDIGAGSHKNKKKRNIQRDVLIFFFILLGSFVFWFLNTLGKEYEASIDYHVNFINIPKTRVIDGDKDVSLDLRLKGSGSALMRLKLLGKRRLVDIDLSEVSYKSVPGKKGLDYFIVSSGLEKTLVKQIRTESRLVSVKPDTLFFTMLKSESSATPIAP